MKKIFQWAGIILGGFLGLIILTVSLLVNSSNRRLAKKYSIEPSVLAVKTDSASLERGRRWATVLCANCHGADFGGTAFFVDSSLATVNAPNLTSGKGGIGSEYTYADWVRSIRYGVDPAGRALFIMPSKDFNHLSTTDLSSLIAYLQTIKPVDKTWDKEKNYTILGKVLISLGAFGEVISAEAIDYNQKQLEEKIPEISVDYGKYVVDVFGCRTCHGNNLAGGKDPNPAAPYAPGLIKGEKAGSWTESDFIKVMHTGETPDGRRLSDFMPWKSTANMSNDELIAVHQYLQSLPSK